MTRKTVRYRCGCEVELAFMGKKECGLACAEHFQPVERITTVEDYL